MTKTITTDRAKAICAAWHGGQWSALYQFASTGIFHLPNTLRYLQEVLRDLEPEGWSLHPVERTQAETKELTRLRRYFERTAAEHNVPVEYGRSEQYGYEIPYLAESVPDDLTQQVTPLVYPR